MVRTSQDELMLKISIKWLTILLSSVLAALAGPTMGADMFV
jgi:hypothetical protein